MNYAAEYNSGLGKAAKSAAAKTATPKAERLRTMDAKDKRCGRNPKRQAAVRTDCHAADGFLRNRFLPLLNEPQALRASMKLERDFYGSLSLVAKHYGIEPMASREFGYPYNIALALQDAERQLKKKVRNFYEMRVVREKAKTYFTLEERYATGSTLYYIPVFPLYRMLKDRKHRHAAHLLLSVFAYLYHVADIPYYRREDSYLYWQYEMIDEWVQNDGYDGDELKGYLDELKQAAWIGDRMEQKIYSRENLRVFSKRLSNFKARDAFDRECEKLAAQACWLYENYPSATVFRNARRDGEAEDESDEFVPMDRYVSFCADAGGWLSENIVENINMELQEYALMEEPIITKKFDGRSAVYDTLDFENRLFDLIDDLICQLD